MAGLGSAVRRTSLSAKMLCSLLCNFSFCSCFIIVTSFVCYLTWESCHTHSYWCSSFFCVVDWFCTLSTDCICPFILELLLMSFFQPFLLLLKFTMSLEMMQFCCSFNCCPVIWIRIVLMEIASLWQSKLSLNFVRWPLCKTKAIVK